MHAKCSPHHIINGCNQHGLLDTVQNMKLCTMSYFQYCGFNCLKNTNFFLETPPISAPFWKWPL